MNMAIDEALLESMEMPAIRFYRWDHPALSFGYFGRFCDVENLSKEHDLVRRRTGGGIVFHGNDLTYSIVIPPGDPSFSESSMSIYEKTHEALRVALAACGQIAELVTAAAVCDRRNQSDPAIIDGRSSTKRCFANPVRADVMVSGRKIAGAAQRRTQRGLLQQGSVQHSDQRLADRFASELSRECQRKLLDKVLLARAEEIAEQKYRSSAWLRRR
jgi:lipoyl(octanoyl) transferase